MTEHYAGSIAGFSLTLYSPIGTAMERITNWMNLWFGTVQLFYIPRECKSWKTSMFSLCCMSCLRLTIALPFFKAVNRFLKIINNNRKKKNTNKKPHQDTKIDFILFIYFFKSIETGNIKILNENLEE